MDEGRGERRRPGFKCGRGHAMTVGKWQCGRRKLMVGAPSGKRAVMKGNNGDVMETPS